MRVCPECGQETSADTCPHDGRATLESGAFAVEDHWLGSTIADKYVIGEAIGQGGMGTVYKAAHLGTGGTVAVKLLHRDQLGDAQAIKRFHLEAQNSAGLTHANTIRVTDFGVTEGTPYLVMEHLEGRPLNEVLESVGNLRWQRAVRIGSQVLKSLWEAHEHPRRIVHRDIKPQNIFVLDQRGDRDFVKVLDFGISRALESSGLNTIGMIGTPYYMSPEQWRGDALDARSDLYSVGCIIYEMLAGHPPFQVPDESAASHVIAILARAHAEQRPPTLTDKVASDVPAGLIELVDELLAKDPAARPKSAHDTLNRLGQLQPTPWRGDSQPTDPHAMVGGKLVSLSTEHAALHDARTLDDDEALPQLEAPAPAPLQEEPGAPPEDAETSDDPGTPDAVDLSSTARVAPDSVRLPAVEVEVVEPAPAPTGRRRTWLLLAAMAVLAGGVLLALHLAEADKPDPAAYRAALRDKQASAALRTEAIQFLLGDASESVGGLNLRGAVLSDVQLGQSNLTEADLQEADLRKSDLHRAVLQGANLRKANLNEANLRGAVLRNADLRGAQLRGAILTDTVLDGSRYNGKTTWPEGFDHRKSGAVGPEAVLQGVDLRGADMRAAQLPEANIKNARLHGSNLEAAGLQGANLSGARLIDAVLRNADLTGADLRNADLSGADLTGAKLDGANLRGARYSRETRWPANFQFQQSGAFGPGASLARAELGGRNLKGTDLRDADLSRADLRKADLRNARLQGTDLSEARLAAAKFGGAVYDGATRWPEGFDARRAGARFDSGTSDSSGAKPTPNSIALQRKQPASSRSRRRAPRVKDPVVAPPPSPPAEPKPEAPKLVSPGNRKFAEADLRGEDLSRFDLSGVDLRFARYSAGTRWPKGFKYRTSGALGPGAILPGVVLRKSSVRGVDLRKANLRSADLRQADMRGARLQGADLRQARLQGARMERVQLKGTRLNGAIYSRTTVWPTGFNPDKAGAARVD